MTKLQLEIKIAGLEAKIEGQRVRDEEIKQEFAKAFGWFESRGIMHARFDRSDEDPQKPSWSEIFVKVGKLLQNEIFSSTLKKVEDIEKVLQNDVVTSSDFDLLIKDYISKIKNND